MVSLFEVVFYFGEEYEELLNHMYIFLTFVIMYTLLHDGSSHNYIFTTQNTLIFFVSLCAYHLLFSKILKVKHESSENKEN